MTVLQIFRGEDFLEEVVLSRAVMGLGRHPQNDIVLDDRSLSRFHARVERRGDRFVVVDCGAQNGVHLNGERIVGESDLAPGDRITLGRYVAVFDSGAAARGTPPSAGKMGNDAPAPHHSGGASPFARKSNGTNGANGHAHDEEGPDNTKRSKPREQPKKVLEPTLVLLFNGMEVSRHPIGANGLTVGRSKASDVVISLLGLSRKHARITRTASGVTVEDLGSQNGTWVNNQRINKNRKLKHGDLLNFYDYAVLFLEDGEVEVGFPGAGFSAPSSEGGGVDELSQKETDQSSPPSNPRIPRPATGRSPVPLADSNISGATAGKAPQPSVASELADLGEGSFLGDEFEEEAGARDGQRQSSVLDDDPLDDIDMNLDGDGEPQPGGATDVVEDMRISSELKKINIDDAAGFDDLAGTEGEAGKFEEKTSATHGETGSGRLWASDAECLKALSNAPDSVLVNLEVMLSGKPYTQMPLSQTVTRVGADPRCELSLPKSSGLAAWHLTLLHLGGSVVMYRAGKSGKIQLGDNDVDMTILKDGDLIDLGKVKLKVKIR